MKEFDPGGAATSDGIFGLPDDDGYRRSAKVILIPVPVEITTSYGTGTAKGPAAILKASRQVEQYDSIFGNTHEAGIFMEPASRIIIDLSRKGRQLAVPIIAHGGDIGSSRTLERNLARVNQIGAEINEIVHQKTGNLLAMDKTVGIVGGDHSVSFGAIKAYAEEYPGLGILHIDAHMNLRQAFESFRWSHASVMFNVMSELPLVGKLVQVGVRDYSEEEFERAIAIGRRGAALKLFSQDILNEYLLSKNSSWEGACKEIVKALPPQVYISFDIDGLDPSLCPHTGTPVPGGLTYIQTMFLLNMVAHEREVVGFDLVEVAPNWRNSYDEWDGNVGARILYKLIGCLPQEGKAEGSGL